MKLEALLQTHAEVAIALAGFASVVAALRRPLPPQARQRFLSLLALSVIQILGCLLPVWLLGHFSSTPFGWRVLSAALLTMLLMRLWWLILRPGRTTGVEVRSIISPVAGRLIWAMGLTGTFLFLLNVVGLPFRPGFDLYYSGLLLTLLVGFALFADVVVSGAGDPSA